MLEISFGTPSWVPASLGELECVCKLTRTGGLSILHFNGCEVSEAAC